MGSPDGEACLTGYTGGGCPNSGVAVSELGRSTDETLHYVRFTRSFELLQHEVTQGEWKVAFPGWNPSTYTGCGDSCPVETVSRLDALAYANATSVAVGANPCYLLSSIECTEGTSVATSADCMTSVRGGIKGATVALNGTVTPYECAG